jgi:hypothetical protein
MTRTDEVIMQHTAAHVYVAGVDSGMKFFQKVVTFRPDNLPSK